MSCLDVIYPPYGHYAPYDTAVSAFGFNSLQGAEDGPREKQEAPEAEYLNSRCVLFTYYHGDISSVVDEHFSRALSSYIEGEGKKPGANLAPDAPTPGGRRSFPPSFWDSNYPPSSAHRGPCEGAPPFSVDAYPSPLHPALAQPHPHHSESWAYAQGQAYGPPRPLHELYGPAGLDPHYGALLMPTVRPAHLSAIPAHHYDVNKLDPASAWPGLLPAGDVTQALALNMDAGLQKGKELYWF
ncbi:hypothetical protein COCON_G00001630 [Conger conger]|uniref:Transcription cofactor vestigial-like protein 2 n=1 Tax=Conger conger TaxID=82655 RepID=A0A9Q1I7C3_CONCO|nr:hypothetical protein COCON_G00001630 [Conger conger]